VLAAAFAAGEVSGEHAAVTCQALAALPDTVDAETETAAESYLVAQARLHDPKSLARLGTHLRHVLDPDAGDTLAKDEEHQRLTRTFDIRQRGDGFADVRGHLDAELTAALLAQLMALAAGTDGGPTRHGTRPTIAVHLMLETLQRRLGAPGAHLDWAGPISAEAARRLACDAKIIPVVLGAAGEPLDVGRASYPVTQAIWRALVARDGGCASAAADDRRSGPRPTTASTGRTAARPRSRTAACSATTTTASSTTKAGTSPSSTASSTSSPHPGSTLTGCPARTPNEPSSPPPPAAAPPRNWLRRPRQARQAPRPRSVAERDPT